MIQPRTPEERYGPALDLVRRRWGAIDPKEAAWKCGAEWVYSKDGDAHVEIRLLGTTFVIDHPGGRVTQLDSGQVPKPTVQLILLHHLVHADGTPAAGRWAAFRDLPDARWYEPAFASGVNGRILSAFGCRIDAFREAAGRIGGEPLAFGDASYLFRMLPRLWMGLVLHAGDDEFGPQVTVLFDASAGNQLPAEDLVYVGGYLAGQLVRAADIRSGS